MGAAQGIRMKNPAHPGGFVKSEIVEALGLSVTDAARMLGVTRPALSALLNERASLSPEMALRIEKVFGVSMDTLMRMQTSHDIARVRRREDDIRLVPFAGQGLSAANGESAGPSQPFSGNGVIWPLAHAPIHRVHAALRRPCLLFFGVLLGVFPVARPWPCSTICLWSAVRQVA